MTARIDTEAVRERVERAVETHAQDFETFFLARLLDLAFEYLPTEAPDVEKDACHLRFPAEAFLFNPQGSLHGGVMATAMDISMGHLLHKVAGAGATVEMKTQFMRPVTGGEVTVEGRFLRRGRSLSFMESRLMDAEGRLCALSTATWAMPRA